MNIAIIIQSLIMSLRTRETVLGNEKRMFSCVITVEYKLKL